MKIQNFLYHKNISYNDLAFKQAILNDFYTNGLIKTSNWDCHIHSSFGNHRVKIPDTLKSILQEHVDKFTESLDSKFFSGLSIHDIWYNLYTKGMFQEKHQHGLYLFSGIFYFKFNKQLHNPTTFYNNFFKEDYHDPCFSDVDIFSYTPDVQEGDLILFPSYMSHSVNIQKYDEPRITIAFNLINKNIELVE